MERFNTLSLEELMNMKYNSQIAIDHYTKCLRVVGGWIYSFDKERGSSYEFVASWAIFIPEPQTTKLSVYPNPEQIIRD